MGTDTIHYSVVTQAELFAGRGAEESRVALLAPFPELPIDRAVAERAGRLRRERSIRLPDALIAAAAIEHGCVLVTRNVSDFKGIPRLRVRKPPSVFRVDMSNSSSTAGLGPLTSVGTRWTLPGMEPP